MSHGLDIPAGRNESNGGGGILKSPDVSNPDAEDGVGEEEDVDVRSWREAITDSLDKRDGSDCSKGIRFSRLGVWPPRYELIADRDDDDDDDDDEVSNEGDDDSPACENDGEAPWSDADSWYMDEEDGMKEDSRLVGCVTDWLSQGTLGKMLNHSLFSSLSFEPLANWSDRKVGVADFDVDKKISFSDVDVFGWPLFVGFAMEMGVNGDCHCSEECRALLAACCRSSEDE